jgi:dipeptide/tripeptide permease
MRALLVLYMSNVFLFSDDKTYATFGAFSALLYVTPVIGGWIGDVILGYRRALVLGGLILALGFVGTLSSGFIAHHFDWPVAFGMSGVGLLIAVATFLLFKHHVANKSSLALLLL